MSERRVLLVDDDPIIDRSFARTLSGKGYAVITAESGHDALDKLAAEHYDAVYADLRMPDMSGFDLAERIKDSQPWMPVVIITRHGSDEDEARDEARAEVVDVLELIHKPLTAGSIEETVQKAREYPVVETEDDLRAVCERRAGLVIVKDVAMFLAAPLIALAYVVLLPLVGLGVLVWIGYKKLRARHETQA